MKSSLSRTAVLCFVLCLCISGKAPARSPAIHNAPPASPTATPAEVIPPRPAHWCNDYALAVTPDFASALNHRLEDFEHETSNQFVVAIFPHMESHDSLDAYCRRVFNAWGIGQKGVNNGVVLFLFLQDHKVRIQVGRGLETPLTKPICQDIIQQMLPSFRASDIEGGVTTCVDAVIKILKTQPPTPRPAP